MTSLLLVAAIAFLLGGGAVYLLRGCNRDKEKQLETELENLRAAFESYRQDVGRHFSRTAELVDRMTESYRAVYDHLSESAQQLVYDRRFDERGQVIFDQQQRPSFAKTSKEENEPSAVHAARLSAAHDVADDANPDADAPIGPRPAMDYAPRPEGDTRASIFRPESFKED